MMGKQERKTQACVGCLGYYDHAKGHGGLGFRDLELFNLALLSRQAWRVMNDPGLLSARILKSVYYPHVSLLDAELGCHPSQIWRAILDGRDIMAEGIIRRIRDGESTNIWAHNWIPREGYRRPITSLTQAPPQLVSELIEPSTASWRVELVRSVFTPFELRQF